MIDKDIKDLTQEELEQLEDCDCQEEQTLDDRLVELELLKEQMRLEREDNAFDLVEISEADSTSKEIARDADAYANFYSRLVLSGIHSDVAGQLLMNYMTTRHNIKQAELDVEKAKYQSVQLQSQVI